MRKAYQYSGYPMDGKVIARDGYVLMEHDHVSDASNIFQRIRDAAMLMSERKTPRLLVDARYYHPMIDDTDRAMIADRVRSVFPPDVRIAVLLQEMATERRVRPIMETLAGAGIAVQGFRVLSEAETWLQTPGED